MEAREFLFALAEKLEVDFLDETDDDLTLDSLDRFEILTLVADKTGAEIDKRLEEFANIADLCSVLRERGLIHD